MTGGNPKYLMRPSLLLINLGVVLLLYVQHTHSLSLFFLRNCLFLLYIRMLSATHLLLLLVLTQRVCARVSRAFLLLLFFCVHFVAFLFLLVFVIVSPFFECMAFHGYCCCVVASAHTKLSRESVSVTYVRSKS